MSKWLCFWFYIRIHSVLWFLKLQVTRLCDKISASSAIRLTNCDSTKHECVTYSRTRKYVYRCRETETSQDRQGGWGGKLQGLLTIFIEPVMYYIRYFKSTSKSFKFDCYLKIIKQIASLTVEPCITVSSTAIIW